MGDCGEDYKALRQIRQGDKQMRKAENLRLLDASGLKWTEHNGGDVLLFRQDGKPKADFYPTTGRWKVGTRFMGFGARAFLRWWGEQ